jgi:hypothetical protein
LYEFCRACRSLLPSLDILELSCDVDQAGLVFELCKCLNIHTDHSWKDVVDVFKRTNRKLLVVIDEFNLAYTASFSDGDKFIAEVNGLGGEKFGISHCILSGSSTQLRKLITAKYEIEDAKRLGYLWYSRLDLNGSKFSSFTILPFIRKSDFASLVQHVSAGYNSNSKTDVNMLYYRTGGFPGQVSAHFCSGYITDSYTSGLRDIERDECVMCFLRSLLRVVQNFCEINSEMDDVEADEYVWVATVDVSVVLSSMTTIESSPMLPCKSRIHVPSADPVAISNEILPSTLFELADAGFIQYIDASKQVGFYSPRIFLEVLNHDRCRLTLTELIALKYPRDEFATTAEVAIAKLLSSCPDFWTHVGAAVPSTLPAHLSKLVLPGESESPEDVVVTPNVLYKELLGLKKCKDCLGADFAILDSEKKLFRFQLKLGYPDLEEAELFTIMGKYATMRALAADAYSKIGITDIAEPILITTRKCIGTVTGMRVMDGQTLRSCSLWPSEVLALGRPFKK